MYKCYYISSCIYIIHWIFSLSLFPRFYVSLKKWKNGNNGRSIDRGISDRLDLRKTVWILAPYLSWLLRQMYRRATYIFHRLPTVWILFHREVQRVQPSYVLGLKKKYNILSRIFTIIYLVFEKFTILFWQHFLLLHYITYNLCNADI